MSNVSSLPEHPFVACFVDGVPVNALVDTGSMKSFISDRVHNIIDFNCAKLNKSHAQRCTSITGGDLDITGTISAHVTFQRSKYIYHSSFLVTSNIPYDCVLGWDFIVQHKLGIRGECLGGRSSYQLVGSYGKTPNSCGASSNKDPIERHCDNTGRLAGRSPSGLQQDQCGACSVSTKGC